jgi:hypothetical protein
MRKEQAELNRLAVAVGPDSTEAALDELLNASLAEHGQLSPDQVAQLGAVTGALDARLTRDPLRDDQVAYFYARRLLRIAKR